MDRRGYSLVELLAVAVIIGLLSLGALPYFLPQTDDQRVAGAARELADAFRFARADALRSAAGCRIEINIKTESFSVVDAVTGSPFLHPVDKKNYSSDFENSQLYRGVDIVRGVDEKGFDIVSVDDPGGDTVLIHVTMTPGGWPVVSRADGQPAEGAVVALSFNGHSRLVTVDSVTGRTMVKAL